MKRTIYIACIIALIAAIIVMPAAAFEPGECDIEVHLGDSIDTKVDSASDGQTVCVYAGTYGGFITIDTPNIILKGEGAAVVTYDGESDHKIIIGDTMDASGCILEGFTIKGDEAGADLVRPLAPDCIVRNCVFEGMTNDLGVLLQGENTTFMNNVVSDTTGVFCALYIEGSHSTIVNNTVRDNTGAAISLDGELTTCENNIVTKNNLTSNDYAGIELWEADSGNKIYLNNFIDNGVTVTTSGSTAPAVTYWNSTEQIEYVCPSDGTYTNYLGNYWSDYTTKYPGASEDGCGIWDTTYEVPDSLGEDYRPLMDKFENYFEEAEPTPTPTPGPGPGPVGVPEFNAMGLVALVGVLSVLLAVTAVGSKRKRRE